MLMCAGEKGKAKYMLAGDRLLEVQRCAQEAPASWFVDQGVVAGESFDQPRLRTTVANVFLRNVNVKSTVVDRGRLVCGDAVRSDLFGIAGIGKGKPQF